MVEKHISPEVFKQKGVVEIKFSKFTWTASKWKWDFNKVPEKRKCDFNKSGKQGYLFNKKVVPKNFAKFAGKHLRHRLFCNIVAGR